LFLLVSFSSSSFFWSAKVSTASTYGDSLNVSLFLFLSLSVCLFLCLSICLSLCLSVCLSTCLSPFLPKDCLCIRCYDTHFIISQAKTENKSICDNNHLSNIITKTIIMLVVIMIMEIMISLMTTTTTITITMTTQQLQQQQQQ